MEFRHSSYDNYWRFNHELFSCRELHQQLCEQGREMPASSCKSQLIDEADRTARGDLDYGKQSVKVLRGFIRQRRLQLPKNCRSVRRLGSILKADDDGLVFSRFLDLPPELRERIYGFYIAGFPPVLEFPSQPPLARASKLMRKEVLPVFYKQATFRLTFTKPKYKGVLNLSLPTFAWLRAQPTELDGCMRKIKLRFSTPSGKFYDETEPLIELDSTGTRFTITQAERRWSAETSRQGTLEQEKAYLEKALTAICGEEGKKGIGINEVYLIRKEAEAFLWGH